MAFKELLSNLNFKPKVVQVFPKTNEKLSDIEMLNQKLDAMVVVPVLREGLGVLDTILSVATQSKDKWKFVHGLVLVLNKRTDSGAKNEEDKKSNLETLKLLYYIRYGISLFKGGELTKEMKHKVMKIRESGLPVFLIDASTDGYNTQKMTVGLARRLGTEFAFDMLKDDGEESDKEVFVVGTDADTQLSPLALSKIKVLFGLRGLDAGALGWEVSDEGLSDLEKNAHMNMDLVYGLQEMFFQTVRFGNLYEADRKGMIKAVRTIKGKPALFEDILDMPGAGSTYNRKGYRDSEGHKVDQGFHEDTDLIFKMLEKGNVVKDLSTYAPEAYFVTKTRTSDRPEDGFGNQISKFAKEGENFADLEVLGYRGLTFIEKVAQFVSGKMYLERGDGAELYGDKFRIFLYSNFPEIGKDNIRILGDLYVMMDGKANNFGHHRLVKEIKQIAEKIYPKQRFSVIREEIDFEVSLAFEDLNHLLKQLMKGNPAYREMSIESIAQGISMYTGGKYWKFLSHNKFTDEYKKYIFTNMCLNIFRLQFSFFRMLNSFDIYIGRCSNPEEKDLLRNLSKEFIEDMSLDVHSYINKSLLKVMNFIKEKMSDDMDDKEKKEMDDLILRISINYGSLERELSIKRRKVKPKLLKIKEDYPDFFISQGVKRMFSIKLN